MTPRAGSSARRAPTTRRSAPSTDPRGGDLQVNVSALAPLATYYLKVESAGATYGVGSYHLRLESIPLLNQLLGTVSSTVQALGQTLTNNDLHTNDSSATATNLFGGLFTSSDTRFDASFQGSISDSWDKDYY